MNQNFEMKHDVFISYNTADLAQAEHVRKGLADQYIPCWMAPYDIPTGANYAEVIPAAIRKARFFLLILSRNSMASEQVKNELNLATTHKRCIIVYRLDNTPLTDVFQYHVGNKQWIDAVDRPTMAIFDVSRYIYDEIEKMPKMEESPEDRMAKENPLLHKKNVIRIGLAILIMIAWVIIELFQLQTENHSLYATNMLVHSFGMVFIVLVLLVPVMGGYKYFFLYLLDAIREIIMGSDQTNNSEDRKDKKK